MNPQWHSWTLWISYGDELSSKFKENNNEIMYENQKGNIFSNAYFTFCIKYKKSSLKKILWSKYHFVRITGNLSHHLRSTFKNSVFHLGLGEIFLLSVTQNLPFATSGTWNWLTSTMIFIMICKYSIHTPLFMPRSMVYPKLILSVSKCCFNQHSYSMKK